MAVKNLVLNEWLWERKMDLNQEKENEKHLICPLGQTVTWQETVEKTLGKNPDNTILSIHISLGISWLWQCLRLTLFLMTLAVLMTLRILTIL